MLEQYPITDLIQRLNVAFNQVVRHLCLPISLLFYPTTPIYLAKGVCATGSKPEKMLWQR